MLKGKKERSCEKWLRKMTDVNYNIKKDNGKSNKEWKPNRYREKKQTQMGLQAERL